MKKITALLVLFTSVFNMIGYADNIATYDFNGHAQNITADVNYYSNDIVLSFYLYDEHGRSPQLTVSTFDRINAFHKSINVVYEKYKEWTQTAKLNNVNNFKKAIEVNFPPVKMYWYDDSESLQLRQNYTSELIIGFMFVVDNQGHTYVYSNLSPHDKNDNSISAVFRIEFNDLNSLKQWVEYSDYTNIKQALNPTDALFQ